MLRKLVPVYTNVYTPTHPPPHTHLIPHPTHPQKKYIYKNSQNENNKNICKSETYRQTEQYIKEVSMIL